MKKGIILLITILVFILFNVGYAKASGKSGASINYKYVSDTSYAISVFFYRNCAGIAAPLSAPIECNSISPVIDTFLYLELRSSREVTPTCAAYIDSTTCMGGTLFGVQEYIYMDTIMLPRGQWTISFDIASRDTGITDVDFVSPSSVDLYVAATLDNANFPVDNSPVFINIPTFYLTAGQTYDLNFGAYDIDGDSLSYEFDTSLTYVTGLSDSVPMFSSTAVTFNYTTGIMNVTPDSQQATIISLIANKYRQRQLIGSAEQSFEIMVGNVPVGQMPTTTGINGTGQFEISVCARDTLQFTLPTADPDSGQVVTFNSVSTLPGATFTADTSSRPTGTFFWAPDSTMVSGTPYILYFELDDNACPFYGRQAYAIKIYVNNCHNGGVWPGDANNDFVANVYDLLAIGLAYNDTGSVRPGASTNWVSQPCADWADSIPSGVNAKNADCNGDGVVDSNDVGAIYLNYGLTHNKTSQPDRSAPLQLYGNLSSNIVRPGDTLLMAVMLGDSINAANNVYGLAFSLNYDNRFMVIDSTSANFSSNWLRPAGGQLLSMAKFLPGLQSVDIGAVRTNHTDTSGNGEILKLRFFVKDTPSITGIDSQSVVIGFSGIKLIDANGVDIPVSLANDTMLWKSATTTGINEPTVGGDFQIYPNPSTGQLNIMLPGNAAINHIDIYNLIGESIAAENSVQGNRATVVIPTASTGIYMVTVITTSGQVLHKRFMLVKE